MYALSRIVVAKRPVRQPHKPGNYEACAEALGQFIGDCIAADSCAALVDELPVLATWVICSENRLLNSHGRCMLVIHETIFVDNAC
jgi:hypothetical protein